MEVIEFKNSNKIFIFFKNEVIYQNLKSNNSLSYYYRKVKKTHPHLTLIKKSEPIFINSLKSYTLKSLVSY